MVRALVFATENTFSSHRAGGTCSGLSCCKMMAVEPHTDAVVMLGARGQALARFRIEQRQSMWFIGAHGCHGIPIGQAAVLTIDGIVIVKLRDH